ASGTPILMSDGTARRIEDLPASGCARLLGPDDRGRLALAEQTEKMVQGVRECVSIVLQDGRTLTCTPDHELLTVGGRWVRADERIHRPRTLPAFLLDPRCPVAVVREFLGGMFGGDGWAPTLHRQGHREADAVLEPPAFSRTAKPEHVPELRGVVTDLVGL